MLLLNFKVSLRLTSRPKNKKLQLVSPSVISAAAERSERWFSLIFYLIKEFTLNRNTIDGGTETDVMNDIYCFG